MKTHEIVKGLGLLAFILGLSCCNEHHRPVTSHYGHGFYNCYYHNTYTKKFYKGMDDSEKYAMRAAKRACAQAPGDEQHCVFAECLFK